MKITYIHMYVCMCACHGNIEQWSWNEIAVITENFAINITFTPQYPNLLGGERDRGIVRGGRGEAKGVLCNLGNWLSWCPADFDLSDNLLDRHSIGTSRHDTWAQWAGQGGKAACVRDSGCSGNGKPVRAIRTDASKCVTSQMLL